MRKLWLWGWVGCAGPVADDGDTDTAPSVDLVSPLDVEEARAGVITDPTALIGGLAAEGRPGDVMLRNDRVRFIVQAAGRDSGGLVPFGGGVLDADIVREDGTPDGDFIVDWMTGIDVGWLPEASTVEVVDDGMDSGVAIVTVQAEDAGFTYFEGTLENPGANAPRGIAVTTTYTLRAGSPLLQVDTTLTADSALPLSPGDILHTLPGIGASWIPGVGRTGSAAAAEDTALLVHHETGLTYGMFAGDQDGSAGPEAGLDLLNFLVSFTSLYEPEVTLEPGTPWSWTRYFGVARDPATLTDAWYATTSTPTQSVTATVTSAGAAVPGARVTALRDEVPVTLAITDADGQVSMALPAGGSVRLIADGAGTRIHNNLPSGDADASSLGHATVRERALAQIRDGVSGAPLARGYGRTEGANGESLELAAPGVVRVQCADTDRFEVRLRPVEGSPRDDAFTIPPPGSFAALGHATEGALDLPVEPGTYTLTAWHGIHHETDVQTVEVVAGVTTDVTVQLPAVAMPDGWWVADTHSHAAPSFDGKLSTTDRALVATTTGIDLWVASEHDVAVDNRPLVTALGLDPFLKVIGSVEVTTLLRGHVNLFPTPSDPDARSGGAWPWWEHTADTSVELFGQLLDHHPGVLVQINHPFAPGMPSLAGWAPGEVRTGRLWWDGFDALEVVVPGEPEQGRDLYIDLSARGTLTAATGSSDSHTHTANSPGMYATWVFEDGARAVAELTDEDVVAAVEDRHTMATNGPFLQMDPLPGSTVPAGTLLQVQHIGPSWIGLDRILVYKDGELIDTVELDEEGRATIPLTATSDASYVIEAVGDTPMQPLTGRTGWLVASAIQVDAGDDGWSAPLPPLIVR